MRVRFAVATLVNTCSVLINVQANMAAGARRMNTGILFTNRKLRLIHSESVPRIRSKASTYRHAENSKTCRLLSACVDTFCRYIKLAFHRNMAHINSPV